VFTVYKTAKTVPMGQGKCLLCSKVFTSVWYQFIVLIITAKDQSAIYKKYAPIEFQNHWKKKKKVNFTDKVSMFSVTDISNKKRIEIKIHLRNRIFV
jgi:predicted transposase YdaD